MILPEEFENRMRLQLKDEFSAFAASYDEGKVCALRVNPLKCRDIPALTGSLGISSPQVEWCPDGFYYDEALSPGSHPCHEAGAYYIQDASAMLPAELLAPAPGEYVLDLCAAPGGKSSQLAGMMQNKGLLVANEIIPSRAKILSENIERMGIRNAVVTCESPGSLSMRFPEFFDKILVDAPCSGEGMFRKNPDAVNEWSPQNVSMCAKRQDDILNEAAKMLRPGGIIVYSTCTFSTEENEGTIERFLGSHPEYEVACCQRLWPHKVKGEGHFAAKLIKKGPSVRPDTEDKKKSAKGGQNKSSQAAASAMKLFFSFAEAAIKQDICGELASLGSPLLFGDQLYLLPEGILSIDGMKVIRPGLHLGTIKKNRFEPAHALAMAIFPEDALISLDLPSEGRDIRDFLSGNVLAADSGQKNNEGWTLVSVDGFSVGWGKLVGTTLKNHYPKGLRRALP